MKSIILSLILIVSSTGYSVKIFTCSGEFKNDKGLTTVDLTIVRSGYNAMMEILEKRPGRMDIEVAHILKVSPGPGAKMLYQTTDILLQPSPEKFLLSFDSMDDPIKQKTSAGEMVITTGSKKMQFNINCSKRDLK